ncbi:hypothetical protein [Pseudohongiella sp. O18]|uniref:hypothetical protein n=1 Tax=Pseudohongiella sp. O18 TaxID=2904248 RepID=UPI001F19ABDF|nr:hypothetical protein [Pseudohongiella sp. O18]
MHRALILISVLLLTVSFSNAKDLGPLDGSGVTNYSAYTDFICVRSSSDDSDDLHDEEIIIPDVQKSRYAIASQAVPATAPQRCTAHHIRGPPATASPQ